MYKYLPIRPDVSVVPGLAACAAHQQGTYHEMKELIWEEGFEQQDLSEEKMEELAKKAGLDMERYRADMAGETCTRWLQESQQTLARFGARGTPVFFINGRFLSGAQPIEQFRLLIDEELEKAQASGVPPGQYYEQVVMEQGLQELQEDE